MAKFDDKYNQYPNIDDRSDYDAYNDEFYDEQLDMVLDEIADMRRTIQPDNMPYGTKMAPYNPNDAYLHQEIQNLRSQIDANKDQALTQEIRRLNDKVNDINRQSNVPNQAITEQKQVISAQTQAMGEQTQVMNEQKQALRQLIAVNEGLINQVKNSQNSIASNLDDIKNQLATLSTSGDMGATLESIKKNIKNSEEFIININTALDNLNAYPKMAQDSKVNNSEILRQLIDLKKIIGSSSPSINKKNDELLDLYNLLNKVEFDVNSPALSIGEKFSSVDTLAKRLYETSEYDIAPIIDKLNKIIEDLSNQPLNKKMVDSILFYAADNSLFNIPNSKKEAIKAYMNKISNILKENGAENIDELPDIIALKNEIQQNKNDFECENIYSSILNLNISLLGEKDINKAKQIKQELNTQIKKITSLEVRDIISYPFIAVSKVYKSPKVLENESVIDKINEIKNFILDANIQSNPDGTVAVSSGANSSILSEINSLKNELYDATNMDNISQAILDLKGDCLTIISKLGDNEVEGGEDVKGAISSLPTLNELVAQLDRLFDDVKNINIETENNIISNLEVLNDSLNKLKDDFDLFNEKYAANNELVLTDRQKMMDDISVVRDILEKGEEYYADDETDKETAYYENINGILNRIEQIENNQNENKSILNENFNNIQKLLSENKVDENEKINTDLQEAVEQLKQTALLIKDDTANQLVDIKQYLVLLQEQKQAQDQEKANTIEEIATIKDTVSNELGDLKEEIRELKNLMSERISTNNFQNVSTQTTYLNEVYSLKQEIAEIKKGLSNINAQPQEINNDAVLKEITKLRDQIFAISMANVDDGENTNFESYNNIILDEIASLREDIESMPFDKMVPSNAEGEEKMKVLIDELENIKQSINSIEKDDNEEVLSEISQLKDQLLNIKTDDKNNEKIYNEILKLKDEITSTSNTNKTYKNDNLSKSLNDLKSELTELATMVNDDVKPVIKKKKSIKPINASNGDTINDLISQIDKEQINIIDD